MKQPLKKRSHFKTSAHRRVFKLSRTMRISIGTIGLSSLLTSTAAWSFYTARLQLANADQLIDPYLFESRAVFSKAQFPADHTFLLKWPVFLLIKFFHFSDAAFIAAGVGLALVTVGGFAYVLYRIERRPVYFGLLCLAIALVLSMVPPQPYSGALLPVNMAMLTTRNIEYIGFIGALCLLCKSRSLKDARFLAGVALLLLVIASDKLFFIAGLGGLIFASLWYALRRSPTGLRKTLVLSGAIALAGGLSWLLLTLLNHYNIARIVVTSAAGPYSVSMSLHSLLLGVFFAITGLATNFGANPSFDALLVRDIPHLFLNEMTSLNGLGYLLNGVVAGLSLWAIFKLIMRNLVYRKRTFKKSSNFALDTPELLSFVLIGSTLTLIAAFITTNHYYPVDARYLAMALFAAFTTLAVWLRSRTFTNKTIGIVTCLWLLALLLRMLALPTEFTRFDRGLNYINRRNEKIASVLSDHVVDILIGDYWRVVPIKHALHEKQIVLPLGGCDSPTPVLTSTAWNIDLKQHSFAYLSSTDKSLTNYHGCRTEDVVKEYGHPTATVVIDGTKLHPNELLLIYDKGIQKNTTPETPSKKDPVSIEQLSFPDCDGRTLLNVVAHQDDDLLFTNPDLMHAVQDNQCIRTVYMTAGDDGLDEAYWKGRQQGAVAAYNTMLGLPPTTMWEPQTVRVNDQQYLEVMSPADTPEVSLIFMSLPDGNVTGKGFDANAFQSLRKLREAGIQTISSVDRRSTYSAEDITKVLERLMLVYKPVAIHTSAYQSVDDTPANFDHSDHRAAGFFTQKALDLAKKDNSQALTNVVLTFYRGYSTRFLPENVAGADLAAKQAAFDAYSTHDGAVCSSVTCKPDSNYYKYVRRQYTAP